MISVREIDYDTNENSEKLFSRLTWAVEEVDGLFGQLANGVTVNTNRHWVGTYNKEKMEFGLIEPSSYLNPKFIQVIVHGKIIPSAVRTTINIKLRLGWYAVFVSSIMILGTIGLTIIAIVFGELQEISSLIIWVLVFPGLWTLILNRKMNKVVNKIEDLFGVN